MLFIRANPKLSTRMHADAFEQLVGEVLSSKGFHIQFTGRLKGLNADLIAIEETVRGKTTKYLVECKRYAESRKVGLHILDTLIGASLRARVSHAMLVTTSTFTKGVVKEHARLQNLRLDLRDGDQLTQWLSDYELRNYGLWLPPGWQDTWSPKRPVRRLRTNRPTGTRGKAAKRRSS